MRLAFKSDEELASICVTPFVRHRYDAGSSVVELPRQSTVRPILSVALNPEHCYYNSSYSIALHNN